MTGTTKLETTPLDASGVELGFEQHRTELTAYCYRMLGSAFEADDAVQETLGARVAQLRPVRRPLRGAFVAVPHREQRVLRHVEGPPAPRAADRHHGRRSRRRAGRRRRRRRACGSARSRRPRASPRRRDPAEEAETRESVRLAFVAALQHLPPRQRAVLILREVLKWKASEVAELLDTTVVSVNSALQRAAGDARRPQRHRAHGAGHDRRRAAGAARALRRRVRALRHRFAREVAPRRRDDVDAAVPAVAARRRRVRRWSCGAREARAAVRGWLAIAVERRARVRAVAGRAPTAATTRGRSTCSRCQAAAITGIDFFVDENLFPLFDLPIHLDA